MKTEHFEQILEHLSTGAIPEFFNEELTPELARKVAESFMRETGELPVEDVDAYKAIRREARKFRKHWLRLSAIERAEIDSEILTKIAIENVGFERGEVALGTIFKKRSAHYHDHITAICNREMRAAKMAEKGWIINFHGATRHERLYHIYNDAQAVVMKEAAK